MVDQLEYEVLPEDFAYFDANFKLIVIGDSNVGKSCLTLRAKKNVFQKSAPTVGFEMVTMNYKISDNVCRLQIWDTCGQEMYRSLIQGFYRSSSLAIIVYSIDNLKSFENIDNWLKEVRMNTSPDAKIFLIGSKCDLEEKRKISTETGQKFAELNKIDLFMETSAKSGLNADKVFVEAAKILNKDYLEYIKSKPVKDMKRNSRKTKIDINFEEQIAGEHISADQISIINKNSESKCKC